MTKQTKSQAAQNKRVADVVTRIGEHLGPEYEAALNTYAEAKGSNWPELLTLDWYTGRDANFRDVGGLLRQIRNHPIHGPAFYRAMSG